MNVCNMMYCKPTRAVKMEEPSSIVCTRGNSKVGRWVKWERLTFLRGLQKYGRGKWKKISTLIPTRSTVQVKSHAQVVLKKWDDGEDIFEELDAYTNQTRGFCSQETDQLDLYTRPIKIEARTMDVHDSHVRLPCSNFVPQDELYVARALLLLRNGGHVAG